MVMLDNEQIYELRMALGMTAQAFGELVGGVTANTVFRWESPRDSVGAKYPSRRHQMILNDLWADAVKKGKLRSLQPA